MSDIMRKYCPHCNSNESTTGTQCYRCGLKFKIHRDNFDPESHVMQLESKNVLLVKRFRVTNAQKKSLFRMYSQGGWWKFYSYNKFRRHFGSQGWGLIGGNPPHQRIFLGIEPDGYVHS